MKINELTEAGETGLLSRMRSGLKSMMPGDTGRAGKAAGVTKLAAKKILDKIKQNAIGAGYGKAPLSLEQLMAMPLFPNDTDKNVLKKAWTAAGGRPDGTAAAGHPPLEDLALKWVQIYQQNIPDAPAASTAPTTDIPNLAGSNGKNYAFKGGKWYLKQGRNSSSWIEIPPTDKRFELLNKKASEDSI